MTVDGIPGWLLDGQPASVRLVVALLVAGRGHSPAVLADDPVLCEALVAEAEQIVEAVHGAAVAGLLAEVAAGRSDGVDPREAVESAWLSVIAERADSSGSSSWLREALLRLAAAALWEVAAIDRAVADGEAP